MTNSYYSIRVKDKVGDTVKYISDYEPEFTEEGWMEINTSTSIVRYNPDQIIMYSIEEKEDGSGIDKIRESVTIESCI